MPTFQRHIHSIRLRTERFFNTDRFILFTAMNTFSKLTNGEKDMKYRYRTVG